MFQEAEICCSFKSKCLFSLFRFSNWQPESMVGGSRSALLEREKSSCQDFTGKATHPSGLLLWWPFGLFAAPELKLPLFVSSPLRGEEEVLNKLGLRFHTYSWWMGTSLQELECLHSGELNPLLPGRNRAARWGLEDGRYLIMKWEFLIRTRIGSQRTG